MTDAEEEVAIHMTKKQLTKAISSVGALLAVLTIVVQAGVPTLMGAGGTNETEVVRLARIEADKSVAAHVQVYRAEQVKYTKQMAELSTVVNGINIQIINLKEEIVKAEARQEKKSDHITESLEELLRVIPRK